ncbi:MAG: TRAP transporter substrate-binding protein DctP [Dokdonella sp.]
MKTKRPPFLGLVLSTALLAALPAHAADVEWKFYTYFAANDKPTQLHKAFAEDILKASNGRMKISVFASGELPYKAADVLRAVASDQVQMGDVALGFVAGDVPELNAFAMPFACTSMDKFYDKAALAVAADVDGVLSQKFKTRSIMQWVMPPQQLWLVKPVTGLDGLKNLKVRSWNREQADLMKLLGGSGVTITPAEVIPALQRGVVDGAFTAAVPALDWKFNEVTKMGYMMNLTLAHQVIAVDEQAIAKLPADLRQLLLDKAREWTPKYRQSLIDADKEARKTLTEKGVTLLEPTAQDMEKLRAISRPMWTEWSDKNGALAKRMLATAAETCR